MPDFATLVVAWQKRHGRRGLPWQGTRDPYRIWLSEVMLQQTQVAAVIPYYLRFLERFPTLRHLARASQEDVLRLWSGLGYYARGRSLHHAARKIVFDLKGRFPATSEALQQLPGVGRSTAAAIAAFAFGERAAILDGNVKRVLARCHGIEGWPGERAVEERLWRLAERLLPRRGIEAYTQGLMDLGATVCTRTGPLCEACPLGKICVAKKKNAVAAIPAPRPKKALPRRSATWLLVRNGASILLEKRPPGGLWGGLWVFPESSGEDIVSYCRKAYGCKVEEVRQLEPIEHGFTHFRLKIFPVLCEAEKPGRAGDSRLWVDFADARGAAVPAPVKRLLALYAESSLDRPRWRTSTRQSVRKRSASRSAR